jgi:hypothetical protein
MVGKQNGKLTKAADRLIFEGSLIAAFTQPISEATATTSISTATFQTRCQCYKTIFFVVEDAEAR